MRGSDVRQHVMQLGVSPEESPAETMTLAKSYTGKSCAYQMRIVDTDLQAYLQRWPFGTGPDPARNLAGCEAIRKTLQVRQTGNTRPKVVLLSAEQARLQVQESQRLHDIFRILKFDETRQRTLNNDFAWEANLVPRSARKVLVIGCGDGMELLFLRAVLPEASITAIDYHDSLTPEVKATVALAFLEGDFDQHLHSLAGDYDLIFSNHTLEHFYTPDERIQTLHGLLAPGGSLISTLPVDANPGSPFLNKVERMMTAAKRFHPLDLVFLDAGHPWKTNPVDLNRTLHDAGFSHVRIYQRAQHLSRFVAGGRLRLETGKRVGLALHALFFGIPRTLAKLLLVEKALTGICRIQLALERRVWFGSNNLKNRYTEEVSIRATKSM